MSTAASTKANELVERLKQHRIAGAIPSEEIEWLAARGTLRPLEPGQVLTARAAGMVEGMFIILSGHVEMHVSRTNGRMKVMEWRGGDISGILPYSRLQSPPGDATAALATEVIVIHRDHFPALVRECPNFTTALVHTLLDRARQFTAHDLQAEKMASLGKLSAGLAHELNNPASAIVRSAQSLHQAIAASQNAAQALGSLGMTSGQCTVIGEVRQKASQTPAPPQSPLELSDREAELEDWLSAHGVALDDVGPLVQSGITAEALEELAGSVHGEKLGAAVQWLSAGSLTHQLADEITQAANRISKLITAVKGFTQMDLGQTTGPVNLAEGLAHTLAIHAAKAGAKAVTIRLEIAPSLPPVEGFVGQLNQVWFHLIENALDAVGKGGSVVVSAGLEADGVVVRVVDDGCGISDEIKGHIFDPFFTTKKIGEGTGLGLDTVRRIVQQHRGSVAMESQPGRTLFSVTLPVA